MVVLAVILPICVLCLLLVGIELFANAANEKRQTLSWWKRLWIIVNLLVWIYEIFFAMAVCGDVKGVFVAFGGGLGDLLYLFILAGLILLHIILLAVFTYKHLRPVFLFALVCLSIYPLIIIHQIAAQGNIYNGYSTATSNSLGLYYTQADIEHADRLQKSQTSQPPQSVAKEEPLPVVYFIDNVSMQVQPRKEVITKACPLLTKEEVTQLREIVGHCDMIGIRADAGLPNGVFYEYKGTFYTFVDVVDAKENTVNYENSLRVFATQNGRVEYISFGPSWLPNNLYRLPNEYDQEKLLNLIRKVKTRK